MMCFNFVKLVEAEVRSIINIFKESHTIPAKTPGNDLAKSGIVVNH